MPLEVDVLVLDKGHSELEVRVQKLYTYARVFACIIVRRLEEREFAVFEGNRADSVGRELYFRTKKDGLVCSIELK